MKVINRGTLKPDDEIYTTGPVVGGVRFHNPPKQEKTKSKAKGNSLLEVLAAITPEQAEENERVMAKRRAEAVARGQYTPSMLREFCRDAGVEIEEISL